MWPTIVSILKAGATQVAKIWAARKAQVEDHVAAGKDLLLKMHSSSPDVSSTRINQSVVTLNVVGMLWYMLIKSGSSDVLKSGVWQAVAIALVVNVMALSVTNKLKGDGE